MEQAARRRESEGSCSHVFTMEGLSTPGVDAPYDEHRRSLLELAETLPSHLEAVTTPACRSSLLEVLEARLAAAAAAHDAEVERETARLTEELAARSGIDEGTQVTRPASPPPPDPPPPTRPSSGRKSEIGAAAKFMQFAAARKKARGTAGLESELQKTQYELVEAKQELAAERTELENVRSALIEARQNLAKLEALRCESRRGPGSGSGSGSGWDVGLRVRLRATWRSVGFPPWL